MKHFSDRLDQLLNERGRGAAAALAEVCGVDRGYISKLQHGSASNPSEHVIRCMANFFGVNVSWLRDGKEPRLSRLADSISDKSENILREQGSRFGAVKGGAVSSVTTLETNELWELVEGLPHMIASATNETVKQRLANDAEAAAHELRERTTS